MLAHLTADDWQAVRDVAAELGVTPEALAALVDFETAGTWDPAIANPYSSARGLLQFLDASARELGFRDADALVDAHPTVASQLRGPVLAYLKRWGPYTTDVSLFMAVFYPAFRFAPEGTAFPSAVQRVNPGIVTVGDYANRVRGRLERVREALGAFVRKHPAGTAGAVVGGLVGLGILGALLSAK